METPLRFRGLEQTELIGLAVPVATTRLSRLLGLALLARESAGAGLLIPRCRSVHTFGMRFPLDLIFFDRIGRVIEIRRTVRPCRFARCRGADSVLELPSPRDGGEWRHVRAYTRRAAQRRRAGDGRGL